MAKINIGGRFVDVPDSLNPNDPPDLRSSGPKANSFGDAAANSRGGGFTMPGGSGTSAPPTKPLFGPHDPVYHGDGRYGLPPNPGATNAGPNQNSKWFNPTGTAPNSTGAPVVEPAGGGAGGAGVVPAAEAVKRPGLRGHWDSAKALPGKVGSALMSPAAGGAAAVAGAVYNEKAGLDSIDANPNATALDKGAVFGESVGRVFGTGAGALAGGAKGAALGTMVAGPVGGFIGGVAGAYYGNKAANAAIDVGHELAGTTSPHTALAPTEPAAPTRIPFDQTPQASYSNEGNNYRGPNPALREQFVGQKALDADLKNSMSNASLQKSNPGGQVTKTVGPDGRVTYSGGNVSGDISLVDTNGRALPGQPGGGFVRGTGDGTQRFATPEQISALRAERNGPKQSAGQQYLSQFGDLSQLSPRLRSQVMQNALAADATVRGHDIQAEGNRQMSLDRQFAADSGLRVKQAEIANQNAIRARLGAYMGADGKKGGEQDIGAARAAALKNGDTAALELIDKYIKDSQDQAKGKTDIVKAQDDELKRRIAPRAFDKDGIPTDKIDEAGQAAIINQARAQYPGLDQMGSKEKDAILSRMGAEHSLLQKLNAAKTGQASLSWHGFTPTYNGNVPTTQTAPDLRGGQIEQAGWLNGVGRSSGDISITGLRGGSGEFNLGQLSAEEMSALKRWTNMKQATAKE